MSIHRDLEQLQEQLSDVKNSLVLYVFGKIRKEDFSLFVEWSEALMNNRIEEAEEKLEELVRLNTPVRSLSQ